MKKVSAVKVWACVFGLWGLFLSGALASFVGSPGIIQAIRLKNLLESKQANVTRIQEEVRVLTTEAVQLEKSKVVQQREIRRVLGYAAQDEIIFDFTAGDAVL